MCQLGKDAELLRKVWDELKNSCRYCRSISGRVNKVDKQNAATSLLGPVSCRCCSIDDIIDVIIVILPDPSSELLVFFNHIKRN